MYGGILPEDVLMVAAMVLPLFIPIVFGFWVGRNYKGSNLWARLGATVVLITVAAPLLTSTLYYVSILAQGGAPYYFFSGMSLTSIWTVPAGIALGGIISAAISYYFARRSSQELAREAEELRRLWLMLIHLLDGAGAIEVKEWDPKTGEPLKWSVGTSREISYRVEAPTPRWKRAWRRVFGG
jgi:hypothetical protein